jgi:homoserine O-acetyltransferase
MSALAVQTSATAAWEDFRLAIPTEFRLASGEALRDTHVLARLHGDQQAPLVAVLGGISAGRCVAGPGGWWADVVGVGAAIDLDRYAVLGIDFAPLGDDRVRITPDDQARLLAHALDCLGVARLHAFVGSSYGGMVGLALAQRLPERLERLCVISASFRPSAVGLAWRGVQRRIVEFGLAHGDADGGLSLARQLAMTTYRSGEEFGARFDAGIDAAGLGEVDRYLIARGQAYPAVMRPRRWLSLSEAIDRHCVDPSRILTPTTLVACPSDQLAPFDELQAFARQLPRLSGFHGLPSIYGHDAFLKEIAALRPILSRALESSHHA